MAQKDLTYCRSNIFFLASRYIDDLVTKEEAVEMLERAAAGKAEREERLWAEGYPAYTTQAGISHRN